MNSDEDEIRTLAHQIWESEGKQEGQADKHWEKATILVKGVSGADQMGVTRQPDPSEDLGSIETNAADQT